MHPLMLKKLIADCHARIVAGDHPTRPPWPTEQLEDAVAELDNRANTLIFTLEAIAHSDFSAETARQKARAAIAKASV